MVLYQMTEKTIKVCNIVKLKIYKRNNSFYEKLFPKIGNWPFVIDEHTFEFFERFSS